MAEVEVTRHAPPSAPLRKDVPEASHPYPSCGDLEIRRYCPACGENRIHQDSLATATVLIAYGGYFAAAARTVYGRAWWLRVIKGAALNRGVYVVLLRYGFMLFFTTYLFV